MSSGASSILEDVVAQTDSTAPVFLGENLPLWLLLALGAALAVGNGLAYIRPRPEADGARPSLLRTVLMVAVGLAAALWALASLLTG